MTKTDELMYNKLVEFWERMKSEEKGNNEYLDYWLDYLDVYSDVLIDIEEYSND
jgi:hypothetical protein